MSCPVIDEVFKLYNCQEFDIFSSWRINWMIHSLKNNLRFIVHTSQEASRGEGISVSCQSRPRASQHIWKDVESITGGEEEVQECFWILN